VDDRRDLERDEAGRRLRPRLGGIRAEWLTEAGGRLFFTADGGDGRELWTTDGTAAGTQTADLSPGSEDSDPSGLTRVGGALFFVADDGSTGGELWSAV